MNHDWAPGINGSEDNVFECWVCRTCKAVVIDEGRRHGEPAIAGCNGPYESEYVREDR